MKEAHPHVDETLVTVATSSRLGLGRVRVVEVAGIRVPAETIQEVAADDLFSLPTLQDCVMTAIHYVKVSGF